MKKSSQVLIYEKMVDIFPRSPSKHPHCEACGSEIEQVTDASILLGKLLCWKCLDMEAEKDVAADEAMD